ncbi:MAG: NUDIX hydrolase [Bacteroidales bacterium]|nr:NUDIX hydrolase [Bacteroidales bacterium]MDD3522066.1 NUDIX hydrolase [Bacteroidales bacterium]MDD4029815.1 NUDIX hydrolase [Bacteroidales bacterium]
MQTNQSISVDCVVFGFDGRSLKCLLVRRDGLDHKLPGSLIFDNEDIPSAAYRVLEEMTGLGDIYLKELSVFSDPLRVGKEDLEWINTFYGVNTRRVVTVAYYALVKLDRRILSHTQEKGALWKEVESITSLAMDHRQILHMALEMLIRDMTNSPIAFELLPKKFTIRELTDLYKAILGVEIDRRNFRKKIKDCGYILPTGEKEKGVPHKPAAYFVFDKNRYKKEEKKTRKLNFINWNE